MPFLFFAQNFAEIWKSSMSYGHKSDFQDGDHRHLEFQKFQFLVMWPAIGFTICCSVPNFIEIEQFFTDIWRFNDFQDGSRPPSWILKIFSFCHVALVDMSFCFPIQHFAEIRQSVNELRPKKRFSRCRHLEIKNFNFWSCDRNRVQYLM